MLISSCAAIQAMLVLLPLSPVCALPRACCSCCACCCPQVLQHQQLVLEVVQQLSRMFKPDFKLIKKRIEDLISRDYLERDKDNPQLFKYLA